MNLNTLNVRGFESDAEAIKSNIKNPNYADNLELEFIALTNKINAEEMRRRTRKEYEKREGEKEQVAREERRRQEERRNKEKERNEIESLINETITIIENGKSLAKENKSDPLILSALINLQSELSNISYNFKTGKISASKAEEKILILKEDAEDLEESIGIGTMGNEETDEYKRRIDEDMAYNILGISPAATNDQIKKSYQKLSLEYHPDKATHATDGIKNLAAEKFMQIKNAYEFLKNRRKFI
jgi:hypothetical protein